VLNTVPRGHFKEKNENGRVKKETSDSELWPGLRFKDQGQKKDKEMRHGPRTCSM
jgi:hypothetical protein